MEEALEKQCEKLRKEIRELASRVSNLKKHIAFKGSQAFIGQHAEMMANIMLSYRHLEDARMRLGKVMQQIQGGVSIFDKSPEERERILSRLVG